VYRAIDEHGQAADIGDRGGAVRREGSRAGSPSSFRRLASRFKAGAPFIDGGRWLRG
jgi:hypothetical protein